MNFFWFFSVLLVVAITCLSGCTGQGSFRHQEKQILPADTQAPVVLTPSPLITPSSTTAARDEARQNPGPLKAIKDSELWFTMQVPESWAVKTERMPIPEGYSGLVYVTSLYNNQGFVDTREFFIITYAISRDYDQALRTHFRTTWIPDLNESTARINGITFDRFESKRGGEIRVAYVARKSSANERGFASMIEYHINASSQYRQQDFESYLSTFHYLAAEDVESAAGKEIKR